MSYRRKKLLALFCATALSMTAVAGCTGIKSSTGNVVSSETETNAEETSAQSEAGTFSSADMFTERDLAGTYEESGAVYVTLSDDGITGETAGVAINGQTVTITAEGPFCGATNNAVKRTADKTPKTIAELQQWYQDRHLPPYETTRFFIGINYKKPKAFGIYQDGDQFIVYKNKANGERAIRYQGTDEAYAVNELYLKLKSEILNQKANNQTRKQQQTLTREQKKEKRKNILITFAIFFAGFVGLISIAIIDMLAKGFGASLFWSVFLAIGLTIASLILAVNLVTVFLSCKNFMIT